MRWPGERVAGDLHSHTMDGHDPSRAFVPPCGAANSHNFSLDALAAFDDLTATNQERSYRLAP